MELGRYLQNTRNPDNLNEVPISFLWFYGQPQRHGEVIYLSRTLSEDLFKNRSRETLNAATATYIHGVFKVLIFSLEGQWKGQQRHKQKKVEDKSEPA